LDWRKFFAVAQSNNILQLLELRHRRGGSTEKTYPQYTRGLSRRRFSLTIARDGPAIRNLRPESDVAV
jgi:hypothetical protein